MDDSDRFMAHIKARQKAIKQAVAAGVGEVGIFWLFRGEVLSDSIPWTLGEEYGDFVNGHSDHCKFWRSLRRHNPALVDYEYDQVPRGRVVYSKKDDKFFVYGSEDFVRDEEEKTLVVSEFHLPLGKMVFRADEHYGKIPGMVEE
jgi:hypothetical protein